MRTTSSRTLRFDVYILDLTRCALVRGETEIRLRPKAFDVLRYLVEHAGRLISKEELIGATWQGISVTDDSLVQCIKDIREALSDHDRRIVKTVPRRGYIFAARVEVSSIAVLPFVDLSDSADKTEHLGEGIAEELTNVLARIAGLRVVSRSSSFRFRGKAHDAREIGKLLNVSAVLEGSVRRARRQLRITARLVDVADGCQSWSETYERQVGDLFAIQEEISRVIAERLSLRSRDNPSEPIPKRHTANIEAYHDYLSGRYFWSQFSKSGIAKACRCWECAIEKDPNYALPYAGLADAYFRSYRLGHLDAREASDKINSSARKALALDETLTEAHVSLANIKIHADRDFVGARRELERALALNPGYAHAHHVYSHYWVARGDIEKSHIDSLRALDIDPTNLTLLAHLCWHYYHAGDFAAAIEAGRRAIDMNPAFTLARTYLGQAYLLGRMYKQAISEFEQVLPDSSTDAKGYLGLAFAMSGQRPQAEAMLAELISQSEKCPPSSYHLAAISLALGDADRAFGWLNDAATERTWTMPYLKLDPILASIRADIRFKTLLDRLRR